MTTLLSGSITVAFHAFETSHLISEAGIYQYILNVIIRNGLLMLVCYLNTDYLFPVYLKQKKYGLYVLCLSGCLLGYTLLKNAHDAWLNHYFIGSQTITNLSLQQPV